MHATTKVPVAMMVNVGPVKLVFRAITIVGCIKINAIFYLRTLITYFMLRIFEGVTSPRLTFQLTAIRLEFHIEEVTFYRLGVEYIK